MLAVVSQHPIPYHSCLWRALAEGIGCKVMYCGEGWTRDRADPEYGIAFKWDSPLLGGYPHQFYRNWNLAGRSGKLLRFINPGLVWEVLTGSHDAVYVHGHNHVTHILAMVAAKLSGKRLILRAISYNLGERSPLKRWLRRAVYGALYRLPDRFLYIGRHNRDYFLSFGVPPHKLIHAPHVVDNDFFAAERDALQGCGDDIKRGFGIRPDQKVVLYCAKLIPKKQPLLLLEAFRRAELGEDWVLLMVGEGAMRAGLERRAAVERGGRVVFTGFLNQSEISKAYAVGDILVLPSAFQETWGLVVNEALNFGCAVIASDRVGCGPELVADKTGVIFPHHDVAALIDALRRLARDDALRGGYQARARAVIDAWSAKEYLAGVRLALRA